MLVGLDARDPARGQEAGGAAQREGQLRARQVAEEEAEEEGKKKEPVVALRQRAWPLIDMLERTAKAGPDANIVWEAAAPF